MWYRFLVLALFLPLAAAGQSSVNTYSPYTFYGLGDLRVQGTASQRGLGGAGLGDRGVASMLNPAALSAVQRNRFYFDFGMESGFFYLKQGQRKTSYNSMNLSDLVFRMPLAGRLGFGASLAPYSSVGYRVSRQETDPDKLAALIADGGVGVEYLYKGSGDISQMRVSLGWEPVKRVSLGAEMIYYFGSIRRSFTTSIINNVDGGYDAASMVQSERVSRVHWNFGVQANVVANDQDRRWLTAGATYGPGGRLNPAISVKAGTQAIAHGLSSNFTLPETFAAGVFYRTTKLGAGFDFERQAWGRAGNVVEGVAFRDVNVFRGGVEYTPVRYDVRSPLKRVTYRVGARYGEYYMGDFADKSVTVGFGVPLKADRDSYLDLGFEVGQRGSAARIRENYFKIAVGFRLTGGGWFQKVRYR